MLEAVGALARLAERVGADRVLYGSQFPLFHVESSALKLTEAALPADVENGCGSRTPAGYGSRRSGGAGHRPPRAASFFFHDGYSSASSGCGQVPYQAYPFRRSDPISDRAYFFTPSRSEKIGRSVPIS